MRLSIPLSLAAIALGFAALPALADGTTSGKPAVTGNDNAVQRIEAATTRHVDILTGLLSKLPAQAQPGIEKAITAAQQGHDKAIAAITGHGGAADDDSTEMESEADNETDGHSGKSDVTGLERAKAAVSAGFAKSIATLQGLLDKVPSGAVSRIQAALDRLDSTRTVALRNLDSLIAGEKPDHPARQDRADRPEAPSRPDRPDRAERPERPAAPERPERPQVPDHPSPMHV